MKINKTIFLLPVVLLTSCARELTKEELDRRLANVRSNYLPLLNTSYEIKLSQKNTDKNGKTTYDREALYTYEKNFGLHFYEESVEPTNDNKKEFIDYYAVTDANGDEIRYSHYDYSEQKNQEAFVGKDIKKEETRLPAAVESKYKSTVSSLEGYASDYQGVDKTFVAYAGHIKVYGIGEEDLKIVVAYKEKDNPSSGDYNYKTDITAIYKDGKISSYKEVTTTTEGRKTTLNFSVSYKEPDIKLPKKWKDYINKDDSNNGTQR